MSEKLTEAQQQRLDWRVRLMVQLFECRDQDTFLALLEAGLNQAESEGMRDAARFCLQLSNATLDARGKQVLSLAASSIEEWDTLNRRDADRPASRPSSPMPR